MSEQSEEINRVTQNVCHCTRHWKTYIVIFIASVLTAIAVMTQCGWVIMWDAVTAGATVALAVLTAVILYVARKQLKLSNDITAADFALRFKHDFFTDEMRDLFMLLDDDQLEFLTEEKFEYFKIKPKVDDGISCHDFLRDKKRDKYTVYEMDDFLLMHLEDLRIFEEKGILDIDYVYDGYFYWLEKVINNDAIKEYRKWSKKDGFDIYEGMERIYLKAKIVEAKKAFKRFPT